MATKTKATFGRGEILCFTGLRGCAAIMVMCYHFTLNMPPDTVPMRVFLLNGYLWVDLFFVLSGFVMAYSQSSAFTPGRLLRAYRGFLFSRLARVYPLYLLVLLESASLVLWRTPLVDVADFCRTFGLNLVMLQAWGLAPSMEGAAWSISTEWGAYLLFPFLLSLTVAGPRRIAIPVGAGAVALILYLAMSPGPFAFADQSRGGPLDLYSSATMAPLFRCLAEFTLGLLAYRVARLVADEPRRWTGLAACAVTAAILFGLSRPGLDAAIVPLFAVLLVVLAPGTGVLARVLGARIPYLLGQWSYSIYLLHDKFSHPTHLLRQRLAGHVPFASLVAMAIAIATVIGCSALMFTCVERPLRVALNKMVRRPLPALARQPLAAEAATFPILAERTGTPS